MVTELAGEKAVVKIPRLLRRKYSTVKLREGRGFSIPELREAGLTIADAKKLGIRVDKRRRSKHEWNVEKLKKIARELRENQ